MVDNLVTLEGDWNLTRSDELNELFSHLSSDGQIAIDLRGVTYADSAFLGALAGLARKFKDIRITLLAPQPRLLRGLKIVGFEGLFTIVERENA